MRETMLVSLLAVSDPNVVTPTIYASWARAQKVEMLPPPQTQIFEAQSKVRKSLNAPIISFLNHPFYTVKVAKIFSIGLTLSAARMNVLVLYEQKKLLHVACEEQFECGVSAAEHA